MLPLQIFRDCEGSVLLILSTCLACTFTNNAFRCWKLGCTEELRREVRRWWFVVSTGGRGLGKRGCRWCSVAALELSPCLLGEPREQQGLQADYLVCSFQSLILYVYRQVSTGAKRIERGVEVKGDIMTKGLWKRAHWNASWKQAGRICETQRQKCLPKRRIRTHQYGNLLKKWILENKNNLKEDNLHTWKILFLGTMENTRILSAGDHLVMNCGSGMSPKPSDQYRILPFFRVFYLITRWWKIKLCCWRDHTS